MREVLHVLPLVEVERVRFIAPISVESEKFALGVHFLLWWETLGHGAPRVRKLLEIQEDVVWQAVRPAESQHGLCEVLVEACHDVRSLVGEVQGARVLPDIQVAEKVDEPFAMLFQLRPRPACSPAMAHVLGLSGPRRGDRAILLGRQLPHAIVRVFRRRNHFRVGTAAATDMA